MAKNIETKPVIEQTKKIEIGTKETITWCPGCPNFLVLEAYKRAITNLINQGYKQENFSIATGIGCHQKIYDYLNLNGVYGLHGRVLPICVGTKLGNPNLTVLGFAGDGDALAEGIEHFVHTSRFNSDITYFIANNQTFALTTGQNTPTSQIGFKSKAEPFGEYNRPLNPIRIALASGATFVARVNPKDIAHTTEIIDKAIKHKGFSFIESVQDCLIFNMIPERAKLFYKTENGNDMKKAMDLSNEWDYTSKTGKIPIGIIFQEERLALEDELIPLKKLLDQKVSWKNLK